MLLFLPRREVRCLRSPPPLWPPTAVQAAGRLSLSLLFLDRGSLAILRAYRCERTYVLVCISDDVARLPFAGCQDKICRKWDIRKRREVLAYTEHEGLCAGPSECVCNKNAVLFVLSVPPGGV